MRTSIIAACLTVAGAAAVHAAPPASVPQSPSVPPVITAKAPNLVPIASRMLKGTVSVRNTGSANAGPFKVTVECNVVGRRGGCAEPPKGAVAAYEVPAFPNKLTVSVASLAPGSVFNHKITFWDALVWPSGNYEFTVIADAGAAVAETNEADNSGGTVMGVP
jgi:hypothetical protein